MKASLLLGTCFTILMTQAAVGGEDVILDGKSPWRCHVVWRNPRVRLESGKMVEVPFGPGSPQGEWSRWKKAKSTYERRHSAFPDPKWKEPGFSDGSWPRVKVPLELPPWFIMTCCLRGKFTVRTPADMKLNLSYRGGVVVYVNGTEVARRHLPEGKIFPDTAADSYPKAAYLDGKGLLLRNKFGTPKKYPQLLKMRDRRAEGVKIPAKFLRKGKNLLAIELHRSAIDQVQLETRKKGPFCYALWTKLAIHNLSLTAGSSGAAAPNLAPPSGVHLWNQSLVQSVYVTDFADPGEEVSALRIDGARNGSFSAKIVAGSDKPIKGLKVSIKSLRKPNGDAIPPKAIRVRYAIPDIIKFSRKKPVRFDGLVSEAPNGREMRVRSAVDLKIGAKGSEPEGLSVQPIWVTVRVPGDAKPGRYTGELEVSAAGLENRKVPVSLAVADFRLPDPKDFVAHIGMVQSPESLAARYKVKMWSEEHWKLIEKSFELLGGLGDKVVYVPVRARTYLGNPHGMVHWIKDGSGKWKHDFSIAERYLDLVVKHMGRVPVVGVYCWDIDTGAAYYGRKHYSDLKGTPFTVKEAGSGKLSIATSPKWGTPESREFWKPVLEGMREVLKKRGLEKSFMMGMSGDRQPGKEAVEDLKTVAPYAQWISASHSDVERLRDQPVRHRSIVWGLKRALDPEVKRAYGWRNPRSVVVFPRPGSAVYGPGLLVPAPLSTYRLATEAAVTNGRGKGLRGVGRCAADFWPEFKHSDWRHTFHFASISETAYWHGGNFRNSTAYILAPAKGGPVATARYEMMREGAQETEARIFLEKALLDPGKRAKLGDELAKRCQKLLDERTWASIQAFTHSYLPARYHPLQFASSGWRERSSGLYELAAEVAGKCLDGRQAGRAQ